MHIAINSCQGRSDLPRADTDLDFRSMVTEVVIYFLVAFSWGAQRSALILELNG